MKNLIRELMDYIKKKKIDYADIRYTHLTTESLTVKDDRIEALSKSQDRGVGIRVLQDGCWGFAAGSNVVPAALKKTADRAIQIAKASATTKRQAVSLAPIDIYVDQYRSPCKEDPFGVSLDEKIDLLLKINAALMRPPKIKTAESSLNFFRTEKTFCSSEGSFIEQVILESGAGYEATAVDGSEVQKRSYPTSHGGDFQCAGYEFIRGLKLLENADRVADEAVALLYAPPCPDSTTTLILANDQLALQVHESCGHPTELDRVLGTEISLAGGSFMTIDKLGKLRYGSPLVNIVQDATIPRGLGSFGYDDEGVKASRTYLIQEGLFVGYLASRETAGEAGVKPNGTMRADGWNRTPLIRMTCINLEPGSWDYDNLISDTDDGILMATNKSWSIDDKRLNFQFGTEIAWRIKNGKVGELYKNPLYTGITPEFWNSCNAICNEKNWRIWGLPSCGKGEPMQTAHVAHGTSPARFKNVKVGVSR